jgi:hypothetical protein
MQAVQPDADSHSVTVRGEFKHRSGRSSVITSGVDHVLTHHSSPEAWRGKERLALRLRAPGGPARLPISVVGVGDRPNAHPVSSRHLRAARTVPERATASAIADVTYRLQGDAVRRVACGRPGDAIPGVPGSGLSANDG